MHINVLQLLKGGQQPVSLPWVNPHVHCSQVKLRRIGGKMKLERNVFHSTPCLNPEQIAEKAAPFLGGLSSQCRK